MTANDFTAKLNPSAAEVFGRLGYLIEVLRGERDRSAANLPAQVSSFIAEGQPYTFTSERDLHEAVLDHLRASARRRLAVEPPFPVIPVGLPGSVGLFDFPVYTEYPASDGVSRLDLLVGPVAVEFKIGGSATDLIRQVNRYLALPEVSRVLVVTTKAKHIEGLAIYYANDARVSHLLLQGGAW